MPRQQTRDVIWMSVFTLICLILVFTSKGAPWTDFAGILFIFSLIGMAGVFALAAEDRKPTDGQTQA